MPLARCQSVRQGYKKVQTAAAATANGVGQLAVTGRGSRALWGNDGYVAVDRH